MEILVQAYSFASVPIAKALVDAHKRGVRVHRSQRKEKYSSADFTAHAGIPTYINPNHAIVRNKVMVIDPAVINTGAAVSLAFSSFPYYSQFVLK